MQQTKYKTNFGAAIAAQQQAEINEQRNSGRSLPFTGGAPGTGDNNPYARAGM